MTVGAKMEFISTRGTAPKLDIRAAALTGLASDGGLYVPKDWPHFSHEALIAMREQSYQEIAFQVLQPFFVTIVPDDDLRELIAKSYSVFDEPDVTPLRQHGDGFYILELFHGPTLAFKDIALQFLGHLFEYFLRDSTRRMTVIGATSGDTGSAAMAALANRRNIDLFILYPEKGPSDIQRKQMTCVKAPNVHALAIQGSFDDCQSMVKEIFSDKDLRHELNLTTVNSINLVRILVQVVYYFFAVSRLKGKKPSFVVPTGNFGDIFAGYGAMCCGLPMGRLVVASNSNDILTRFFTTGSMHPEEVISTLSPSMDIQISSNFERLLFDLCKHDTVHLCEYMNELRNVGRFEVTRHEFRLANRFFSAGRADDAQTLATIAAFDKKYGVLLDPHTAVGVKVAGDLAGTLPRPIVCLATAHAGKFPQTVVKATAKYPELPQKTVSLINQPERTTLLPANRGQVVTYIRERRGNDNSDHHT